MSNNKKRAQKIIALRFIPFFLFFLPSLMTIFEAIIDVATPATNEVNATHGMILFDVVLLRVMIVEQSRSY